MKSLVVYDSFFGNTEKIARTIGKELKAKVVKVDKFRDSDIKGVKLLVVGSPTRAFSATPAIKQLTKGLRLDGVKVATFDTRVDIKKVNIKFLTFMVNIFGYAARPILKGLVKRGGISVVKPEGFFVDDSEGPLTNGELERAKRWAMKINKLFLSK